MSLQESELIWKNGALIPWAEATTHVLTHGLHYGTSIFEGIRTYNTGNGPIVFRLKDHVRRMFDSARVYGIEIPFSQQEIFDACREVIAANNLTSAYIRPIAYIGYGQLGVVPKTFEVDVAIAAFPWGAYLGEEGLKNGIDVCVSSWQRVAPNTIPAACKAGGNYLSSFLVSREAKKRGFAEGIGLSPDGRLSEGAGENLFLVKDGRILTPPAANSILCGITRDTVMKLARHLGLEVAEQAMPREMLYLADEAFFTGTAAEITPIRSVDTLPVGAGRPGPVTNMIQEAFFGLFDGRTQDQWGWLDPVYEEEKAEKPVTV